MTVIEYSIKKHCFKVFILSIVWKDIKRDQWSGRDFVSMSGDKY